MIKCPPRSKGASVLDGADLFAAAAASTSTSSVALPSAAPGIATSSPSMAGAGFAPSPVIASPSLAPGMGVGMGNRMGMGIDMGVGMGMGMSNGISMAGVGNGMGLGQGSPSLEPAYLFRARPSPGPVASPLLQAIQGAGPLSPAPAGWVAESKYGGVEYLSREEQSYMEALAQQYQGNVLQQLPPSLVEARWAPQGQPTFAGLQALSGLGGSPSALQQQQQLLAAAQAQVGWAASPPPGVQQLYATIPDTPAWMPSEEVLLAQAPAVRKASKELAKARHWLNVTTFERVPAAQLAQDGRGAVDRLAGVIDSLLAELKVRDSALQQTRDSETRLRAELDGQRAAFAAARDDALRLLAGAKKLMKEEEEAAAAAPAPAPALRAPCERVGRTAIAPVKARSMAVSYR
jgi:hypothetical protein